MKTLLKFVGFVFVCALTKGFAILAYLIWKYGTKLTDKKAKDGFQKIKWQKQNKAIAFTLCLVGFIVNVMGTPQVDEKPQVQQVQQVQCKFDGTGYVTEQRSTYVELYNVGSKIKNFDGFRHNHKEAYPDNNTQIIAWVQGDKLYGMYIHVNDNQNYIDQNTEHSYMTMISKTHEVITTVQAKELGLYDGNEFKLMDCYIVHMQLDHESDED